MKKNTIFTICALALTSLFGFSCFAASSFNDHAAKEAKADTTLLDDELRYDFLQNPSWPSSNFTIQGHFYIYGNVATVETQTIKWSVATQGSGVPDMLTFYNLDTSSYTSLWRSDVGYVSTYITKPQKSFILINDFIDGDISNMDYFSIQVNKNPMRFEFNEQINYYGPLNGQITSDFVIDSTMVSSSSHHFIDLVKNQPFISGGQRFDTIHIEYVNAISSSYLNDNGEVQTWGVNGYASYYFMYYIDSISNKSVLVNERDRVSYVKDNAYGYYQLKSSHWIASNYRYIEFIYGGNDELNTTLNVLNSANVIPVSFIPVSDGDIGLGAFFTVMTGAFGSMVNLLSISIFPGITLGLLLFTPLIVGIIIAIVWLVKR